MLHFLLTATFFFAPPLTAPPLPPGEIDRVTANTPLPAYSADAMTECGLTPRQLLIRIGVNPNRTERLGYTWRDPSPFPLTYCIYKVRGGSFVQLNLVSGEVLETTKDAGNVYIRGDGSGKRVPASAGVDRTWQDRARLSRQIEAEIAVLDKEAKELDRQAKRLRVATGRGKKGG